MTDDEVLDYARADGFELIERMSAGQWAVGSARGDDDRWPCFLEERQAITGCGTDSPEAACSSEASEIGSSALLLLVIHLDEVTSGMVTLTTGVPA